MPERIQLSREKGWRKPAGAVVVARPTKWGNPWRPGIKGIFWLPDWPITGGRVRANLGLEDVVRLYNALLRGDDPRRDHLPEYLNMDGEMHVRELLRAHAVRIRADMVSLRGRDLACWCPLDQPCHADVLLRLANA
jgi:hypothetical protein